MTFSDLKKINPWDIVACILFSIFLIMMMVSPVHAGFIPDGYYRGLYEGISSDAEACDEGACPVVYLPLGTYVNWTPAQTPYNRYCYPYNFQGSTVLWHSNDTYPGSGTAFSNCQANYPTGFYAYGTVPAVGDQTRIWWVGSTKPDWAEWMPGSLQSSFIASPESGTSHNPVEVVFTDTSDGGPTSWNWSINGVPNGTTRNLTYTFSSAGTYVIRHGVSSSTENDISEENYVVNSWQYPVCSFEASAVTGTSPINIQYTDTSTNDPQSYFWDFNPDLLVWWDVTPDETNTTANPYVTYEGTGTLNVIHSVTNPAGTDVCAPFSINISGVAPQPTPTPNIPFPNQTGICQNSQISLGSTWVKPYDGFYNLQIPAGGTLDGYYPANSPSLISGQYTLELGQYFYNEYNISGQLEYRSSYIVENCEPYPTGTPTPLPTTVPVQTFPTVTGTHVPTATYTNVPSIGPIQTLPSQLIASNTTNMTYIQDKLETWSSMSVPWMNFIDSIMGQLNNIFLNVMSLAVNPILFSTNGGNWIIGIYTQSIAGFSGAIGLITYAMTAFLDQLGNEVQTGIIIVMSIDTMIQLIELKRGGVI